MAEIKCFWWSQGLPAGTSARCTWRVRAKGGKTRLCGAQAMREVRRGETFETARSRLLCEGHSNSFDNIVWLEGIDDG